MNNPCPEFWEKYETVSQLSLKVGQELELAIKDGKAYNIRQDLALIDTNLQRIQELWDTSKVTLKSGEKMFAPHYEALKQIFVDNGLSLTQLESIIVLNESGGIDSLGMSGKTIANLNSFKYLSTLRRLNIGFNGTVGDISPLAALRNLEEINLEHNEISDMSPLANLTKLRVLNLDNSQISDIYALRNLTNLTYLHLWRNKITDISPLSNLRHLKELNLGNNQVEDFSHIQHLTSIKYLEVSGNTLKNLGVFSGLMNLEQVGFEGSQVEDLSPLVKLPKLTRVYMPNNKVRDLNPLTQIPQLRHCSLSRNPGCKTREGKAVIAALVQLGVTVY